MMGVRLMRDNYSQCVYGYVCVKVDGITVSEHVVTVLPELSLNSNGVGFSGVGFSKKST